MVDVVRAHVEFEALYLAGLNGAFPNWGGRDVFYWTFRSSRDRWPADLFMLAENGVSLAGSAVTYRPLSLDSGETIKAACMTGSWTAPQFRGRGLFAHAIRVTQEIAHDRQCQVLMAYVTTANASYRRLQAAGADLMPSAYSVMPSVGAGDAADVQAAAIDFAQAWLSREPSAGIVSYAYTEQEWLGQFAQRKSRPSAVMLSNGVVAVLEEADDVVRVLELGTKSPSRHIDTLKLIRRLSSYRNKKLFSYSVSPEVIAGLHAICDVTPGAVALFDLDPRARRRLSERNWWIANGDRM